MELFPTTFQSNIQNDATFSTFMTNNKTLLVDITNAIMIQEKLYGTSPTHKELIHFYTVLMYKIILPYIYTSLGLTWTNSILFTTTELDQINLDLTLKNYIV